MPSRLAIIIAACVFLLAALGVAAYVVIELRDRPAASGGGDGSLLPATLGGPFSLTDHTGRTVTEADYAGKYLLVFFGFTHCPDICPTTLNQVALTMRALGDRAAQVQPLFVTVDPARDTPAAMAEYVALFDAGIVGLTGTEQEIADIARAYRVHYARAEIEGAPDDYMMDHSVLLYLMGPDGNFRRLFRPDDKPEDMADAIVEQIAEDE
ncbi:MAG: SCO family protein [Dongiaceae bacterium]